MAEQNFIDKIRIFCRSGSGGAGMIHFHRDKFTNKGGPDGGDGGRGGHIILRGNRNLWTLLHLRWRKHIYASNGDNGQSALKTGSDGEDIIIDVPLGIIVRNEETDEIMVEITEHDETKILLEGGMGGQGNWHFRSATRQAPEYAQPGIEGIEATVVIELKMLADVGLVGFPNVGKSTLLAAISAAKPKIANYAFTTLTPNVGVIPYHDNKSFVMADIPGIIEGAHEGKGLGLNFLRHIERNSVLLFMVSAEDLNIQGQYETLLNELNKYNPELLEKNRILAITKSDLLDDTLIQELSEDLPEIPHIFISSVSNLGLSKLKDMLWKELN